MHPQSGKLGDWAAQHKQRQRERRENPNYLAVQPGDVIALNNGRTAACSASIVTATPTITGRAYWEMFGSKRRSIAASTRTARPLALIPQARMIADSTSSATASNSMERRLMWR
jgi:hypothetical protein